MKDKFNRFMYGRYGNDTLNRFLMWTALICAVLSMFIFPKFFTFVTYVLMISGIYRCMSRQHAERYRENQAFLQLKDRIMSGKSAVPKDRTKKVFKCPSCGQKVRVPKGKGTIMITCPKCHTEFKKRT